MTAPKIIAKYLQVIIGISIIKCSIKFRKSYGHVALSYLLTVENDSVYYLDKLHFNPSRKTFKPENHPQFCSHITSLALLLSISENDQQNSNN